MDTVLDNVDLVAKAFTYTVLLFICSGLLSTVFGAILVACASAPSACCARRRPST